MIALAAVFGTFLFLFIIGVAGKLLLWGAIAAGALGLGRLLLGSGKDRN